MDPRHHTLTIQEAAAEADVDVATYLAELRHCEHQPDGPCPDCVSTEDHERVMLALGLPPPF